MGKNLYDNFDIAKDIYQDAKRIVGEKFIELSFSGNEIEISKTEYSQVIIFLYTYSLYKILLIKTNLIMIIILQGIHLVRLLHLLLLII